MMVTESCWHPDIEEFITAKQTPGKLTKFNMSVLATDEFMEAVTNHLPWKLEFPDYEFLFHEGRKTEYNELWDGNLKGWKEKGLPVKVYKEFKDANELWDLIMKSAYNRNEPGIIFIDTVNRLNNLWYIEHLSACNPCGEQYLPKGGVCLLGSFNLTQFIKDDNWDYDKLKKVIPISVRLTDNVNDRTKVPLEEQRENIQSKRRMGLGVLGYASALMLMKVRYGSQKALEMTDDLMEFISNQAYQSSALLAKEKGCFPLFDAEKFLQGKFIQNLTEETKDLIKKYGLRNSHLLSIQPTGNTSSLANNISGGLEPIVFSSYIRTAVQPHPPTGLDVPKNVGWETKTFESTSPWEWKKEGDENILVVPFEGDVWKFDRSRGLVKEVPTCDYAVKCLTERGEWDPKADWAACTKELSLDDHLNTMRVFSKYLDSAMSKTVNVPHDHPYEDFKRLYIEAYNTGTIKGCTVYREGTMLSVLAAISTVEHPTKISKTISPKRPQSLPCDIHQITAASKKWIVLVGLLEGDPYEVFAFQPKNVTLPPRIKKGNLIKIKGNGYNLECEDGWVLQDINTLFESDEHEALTRMISTALRHGTDIEFIVAQLMKSKGTITSFGRAIGRTLKAYIQNYKSLKCLNPQCRSRNLVRENGCPKCLDCGFSGCG
jgi:ribonucleoside-diphosphate reductase alpha chain